MNYVTHRKSNYSINIDGTAIAPTKFTFMGKNFTEKYRQQLDKLLHNDNEELNFQLLMPLLRITEKIDMNEYPISIRVNSGDKFRETLVKILDEFITDNRDTLRVILDLYVDSINKVIRIDQ